MADAYFETILAKYNSLLDQVMVNQVRTDIHSFLMPWANGHLKEVKISGSFAKGTNTTLTSDFDLFVSLSNGTPGTHKEIYESLERKLKERYTVRRQNVSLRINTNGKQVDVVPARNHSGNTNDHWLYSTKKDSYFQTNVHRHIDIVKNSNRIKEIKITKIWAKLHNLEFPSILIELLVIDALNGANIGELDLNFQKVMKHLAEKIEQSRVLDPANTNNIISDSITAQEKKQIADKAKVIYGLQDWNGVIW